jgi:hypothetical protein
VDPGRSVVLRCDDRFKEGKQLGIRLMVDNLSPRADTLSIPPYSLSIRGVMMNFHKRSGLELSCDCFAASS